MCGSGSTSEACLSLNISSISADIRSDQVDATSNRIQSCITKLQNFSHNEIYPPIDSCCSYIKSSSDDQFDKQSTPEAFIEQTALSIDADSLHIQISNRPEELTEDEHQDESDINISENNSDLDEQ